MTHVMLGDTCVGAFHMDQLYTLEAAFGLQEVARVLDSLVAIHPSLRSVCSAPAFWINGVGRHRLDETMLAYEDAPLAKRVRRLPLDLALAVFRGRLYRVQGVGAVFLGLSIHHLVLDGTSQQIVYSQLSQLLAATQDKEALALVPSYDHADVAVDAVKEHVRRLTHRPPAELSEHACSLQVPALKSKTGVGAVEIIFEHIPEHGIAAFGDIAASNGYTLNSRLMGALALMLRTHLGQSELAIQQTYLGREPGQLQRVGSHVVGMPIRFRLEGNESLDASCHHVLRETQRHLRGEVDFSGAVSICYELNDVRPMPRPESQPQVDFKLVDVFFLVNQYADGYSLMVLYDAGKYDGKGVEACVVEWLITAGTVY